MTTETDNDAKLRALRQALTVAHGVEQDLRAELARLRGACDLFEKNSADAVVLWEALVKINNIRNSIIGLQTINWSEHIYPLVAALDGAGLKGMEYPDAKAHYGSMLSRTKAAEDALARLRAERDMIIRCVTMDPDGEIADDFSALNDAVLPWMHEQERIQSQLEADKASLRADLNAATDLIRRQGEQIKALTAELKGSGA